MSDTKPRRYYLATGYCDAEKCNAYLAERDDGEYVEASAYDTLEGEHRALLDESLRVEKALVDELAALKKQIEDAPWILLEEADEPSFAGSGLPKSVQYTHRGKLVNVEKLKKGRILWELNWKLQNRRK